MKYVVDRYEVWVQRVLVDADFPDEAIEKVENSEGEDIEEWFQLSSSDSLGPGDNRVCNPVPFDPDKHELPDNHAYRKYMKNKVDDPDDMLGTRPIYGVFPDGGSVGSGRSWGKKDEQEK